MLNMLLQALPCPLRLSVSSPDDVSYISFPFAREFSSCWLLLGMEGRMPLAIASRSEGMHVAARRVEALEASSSVSCVLRTVSCEGEVRLALCFEEALITYLLSTRQAS
ncbi:hypothetical protein GGP41_007906 [Bipolaris sorokiniana]|uniref:Uncharacterized protein n=1 Tax=Cochliobolus sativus TaxID=45130 RepID=A0A8H6DZM5_COCSA|nr:hypothetical protein GGP41_007906 [Bipolaris sorokiniana]